MIQILVVAHNYLARELLRSAEMIIGEQEGVSTLELLPEDSFDTFSNKVAGQITGMPANDGVLVLSDIYGGSPCNTSTVFCCRNMEIEGVKEKFECICGVNLPMLILALGEREGCSLKELAQRCIQEGRQAIMDVRKEFS